MRDHDHLESFIRSNRSSFDDLKAPPGVWDRIAPKEHRVHRMWKWTAIAASALLLIAAGYITGVRTQSAPDIAGWEEYLEAEKYYEARIAGQMEKMKTLPVGDEVLNDLQMLDEVYQDLRKQLLEDPNANAELLLSAMIRHQQQKLGIMEKVLNRVDKYQSNESKSSEM